MDDTVSQQITKENFFYIQGKKFGSEGKFRKLNEFITRLSKMTPKEQVEKFLTILLMSRREVSPKLEACGSQDIYLFLAGYLEATCKDSEKSE